MLIGERLAKLWARFQRLSIEARIVLGLVAAVILGLLTALLISVWPYLVCLLAASLAVVIWMRYRRTRNTSKSIQLPINDETDEIPLEQEDFVLNPGTTFPLTLYNTDRGAAEHLRKVLETWATRGLTALVEEITPVLHERGVRCREVDQYVQEYGPQFEKALDALVEESQRDADGEPEDRNELREEHSYDAMRTLGVHFDCIDVLALFNGEVKNVRYSQTLAEILARTYSGAMPLDAPDDPMRNDPSFFRQFWSGWKISPAGDVDTCPHCKDMATRRFPEFPRSLKFPLHLSCRCILSPEDKARNVQM